MFYYKNVVGAVELLFCQSKSALLLLSTAVMGGEGLYFHLMQGRTILHQLWEEQHSPHECAVPSNRKVRSFFLL